MLVTPMLTPVCSSNRIRVERDDPLEIDVFEYARREGKQGMNNMLSAARTLERAERTAR